MLHLLIFFLLHGAPDVHAQADPPGGYRFTPPRPPPLDSEEDDDEDEDFEMGDEGHAGVPPNANGMPGMPPPGLPPPVADGGSGFVGGSGGSAGGSTGKLKFKIVEGEFWEKGKKRQRGERSKN